MNRPLLFVSIVLVIFNLVACGEKNSGNSRVKAADAKAWQGSEPPFVAAGWNQGDQASWESQLRQRAQVQNEYNRIK